MDDDRISSVLLQAKETKDALARRMIRRLRDQLNQLESLLDYEGEYVEPGVAGLQFLTQEDPVIPFRNERHIEGVFNGEGMVGEDGQVYLVPPNYASKSQLVEGDMLRLTIMADGRFLYKQRGPVQRSRLVGTLFFDERTGIPHVIVGETSYRLLPAAVSFHQGEDGDEAIVLVPAGAPSRFAALESIVKKPLEEAI
jgi:hypothetical protein